MKDSFNSYPLGRTAQAGTTASVRDQAYLRESCASVVAAREVMTRELIELGFVVLPSSSPGIRRRAGRNSRRRYANRAVLVRHFEKPRTAPICASPSGRQTTPGG